MGTRATRAALAAASAIWPWLAGEARAANNANGGWLWDRTSDKHYFTYGLGFDWKFTETLQWTIEAFGQAGSADVPSTVRPRFQTGLRYRPNEIFSLDVFFGHNITGEGASWLTLGTTIRFPVEGGQPAAKRTGHL